ncbi:unnamed protein product (macronuclear) [Paramecium tetraurelia]|uniref:Uncharacterized protein n=1 Tax=Paramecium tetraurelia TaxID=5888 RepID=A0DTY3_PARTE|nr:uncharacterized protein GSPATT00020184001 [Paramecium tetraurelia]CAK86500.1 unnamed protein product [Paramecium tetraurelia]|eukprot:XP_001453897.1 hypothetical protein (macronuclear) [Paramecium tetraurelia strain d4-2]
MGICQSKSKLKRSGAFHFIPIDFDKLKKHNKEREKNDPNVAQQQSFCQLVWQDAIKISNPQTYTYNNVQTQQIELKKE